MINETTKYDCTNVFDYVHEFKRMCNSIPDCNKCKLNPNTCGIENPTKTSISFIQEWSDSHPNKRKLDAFKELLKGTDFENVINFDGEYPEINHHALKWWYSEVTPTPKKVNKSRKK